MVGKLTESGIKVYVVSSFSIHAFFKFALRALYRKIESST